ncbi:MAG: pirin family protein [Acidimicrobiia bacterium]
MAPERAVAGLEPAQHTVEGEGFEVRRAFPTPRVDAVDPFLLLDHVGPRDYAPGEAKGAPDHPHRGFETVTYIIEGEGEHEDSAGNRGLLRAGDVQWMTAGSGVVHSEMPSARIRRHGGRSHFLQLWVNLPAAKKMVPPRYQDVRADEIPTVSLAYGVSARVIAGTVAEVTGPVETHSPFLYAHVTASGYAPVRLPVPDDHEVFAYVLSGAVAVGSAFSPLGDGTLARFTPAREDVSEGAVSDVVLGGAGQPGECIVVSGRPLREPVARYGPFVMNTRQQLVEAVEDFRAGRMGHIRR